MAATAAVAQGVVNRGPGLLNRHGGHAGEVDDRHVFRVGTGDGVDRAQFADTVGRAERGDPMDPRVAVGRVAGVQFVAATHPFDAGMLDDRVLNRKCVIAGDTEDVVDSDVLQAPEDVLDHCFGHGNSPRVVHRRCAGITRGSA
jgi:hypothetical protein